MGKGNSIFGRLFAFRGRPDRNPTEEFLTEALAYVLNMRVAQSSELIELLLRQPSKTNGTRAIESVRVLRECVGQPRHLRWEAHYYLREIGRSADLVLLSG